MDFDGSYNPKKASVDSPNLNSKNTPKMDETKLREFFQFLDTCDLFDPYIS